MYLYVFPIRLPSILICYVPLFFCRNMENIFQVQILECLKPFRCSLCRQFFSDFQSYSIHSKRHYSKGQRKPSYYRRVTARHNRSTLKTTPKSTLQNKTQKHGLLNDKPQFKHATKISATNNGFTAGGNEREKYHLARKKKPFQCNYCTKIFPNVTTKTRHERIHSKEKPHQCIYCRKGFTDLMTKTRHEKTHRGEKPYLCKYCNDSFAQLIERNIHERIHQVKKHYQCKFCNKSFLDEASMIIHERVHTGEKPFHCKYCNKAFSVQQVTKFGMKEFIPKRNFSSPIRLTQTCLKMLTLK